MIRMSIIALLVIAAALLSETLASNAQSAYSYPWCAIYGGGESGGGGGATSCYFTSWQQCMTTLSGIGGLCVGSPYYHAQPTPPPHRASAKLRRRPQA
ncbi:MAG TPA: DUF3551 domain-containing protein [Xanthobacteraceae bacterium]|nr:DUF3551 domain-containing protein [Xanthobacteraceae bacterium]